METHRRLAPCPAALEDGRPGPSTGMEGEIEERKKKNRNRIQDQEGRSCLVFVAFVWFTLCMAQFGFTYLEFCLFVLFLLWSDLLTFL